MLLAGVLLVSLIAGAVVSIYDAFNGDFSQYTDVRAELPVGQPIQLRSQVQFRQIQVGQVGRVDRTLPGGAIEVTLQIKPSQMARIPANVTARVAPTSLFGTETVILRSDSPSRRHLRAGQVVPAAGGSASLQGTLSSLDHLLTGLHPAEIDSSLGALSTALQGQGPAAGQAIRAFNSFLSGLVPQLPALNGDINLLSPVLNGLSASVPALLDVADNSATVARTLTDDRALISALLSDAAQLSGTGSALLHDISGSLHSFLVNLAPILGDISARPNLPATILNDLQKLTASFLPALTQSPVPSVSVAVTEFVNSPYEAYVAGANLPGLSARQVHQIGHAAFKSLMDPRTYTAANCPYYASEPGPNCPGGPVAATSAPVTSGPAASASAAMKRPGATGVVTAGQQDAVDRLFAALTGRPPAQPATDDVILAPLLQSLAS